MKKLKQKKAVTMKRTAVLHEDISPEPNPSLSEGSLLDDIITPASATLEIFWPTENEMLLVLCQREVEG
jgi:hypothetical protein